MKRIIVPTDFSKLSEQALGFAIQLATPLKAKVDLIHFEEVPLGDTSLHLAGEAGGSQGVSEDALFSAQLFRANNQKLLTLSQKYSTDNVEVTGMQLGGGFLKGMEHYVENHGADLVVIGSTGEESLQEFFSGNHTEQLIEHLNIPVLSIQRQVEEKIEDIVLGLDLLEDHVYPQKALSLVKTISESLDARLHVVNVIKEELPDGLMIQLNDKVRAAGLTNYTVDVIQDRNETGALIEYAKEVDASLIIILSEARSGLYRFFQHSTASDITKKSSIPVLTINKRNLE